MKWLIHSWTSSVDPLTFENGWVNPTLYWSSDYLSMLGFKLIHVSKRGVWHATYCNMMVVDVLVSTQKRTQDIRIHFADITGVLVSHVCYYRFGLSRIIMRLHNIFLQRNAPYFYSVCPWSPHSLLCREFVNCRSGEVMVQCDLCQLWAHEKCTPMEGI